MRPWRLPYPARRTLREVYGSPIAAPVDPLSLSAYMLFRAMSEYTIRYTLLTDPYARNGSRLDPLYTV